MSERDLDKNSILRPTWVVRVEQCFFAWPLFLIVLAFSAALLPLEARASCRLVEDLPGVMLNPAGESSLARIGYGRAELFQAMRETSIPEARGCWASPTGNSDSQLVSVGIAQWNFGQGTLQPLLKTYSSRFSDKTLFRRTLQTVMPIFGVLVFSTGCLAKSVTSDCRNGILAAQKNGILNPQFAREMTALFESDTMIQVQVDLYAGLLTSVLDDLAWVFPQVKPTPLQIKWPMDTRIQQGRFVSKTELQRFRSLSAQYTDSDRREVGMSIMDWYAGLCGDRMQEGVRLDCSYNTKMWRKKISDGLDELRFDLLFMSYLRARTATNREGAYQANAFERRGIIVFGSGSVCGRRLE